MGERYRCDGCGHEVPRGRIPMDNVGAARHNCDRKGIASNVPLVGPSRQGRMVHVSTAQQPLPDAGS